MSGSAGGRHTPPTRRGADAIADASSGGSASCWRSAPQACPEAAHARRESARGHRAWSGGAGACEDDVKMENEKKNLRKFSHASLVQVGATQPPAPAVRP